jgi:hypothetical protein
VKLSSFNCVKVCPAGTYGLASTRTCYATCPGNTFGFSNNNLNNTCLWPCPTGFLADTVTRLCILERNCPAGSFDGVTCGFVNASSVFGAPTSFVYAAPSAFTITPNNQALYQGNRASPPAVPFNSYSQSCTSLTILSVNTTQYWLTSTGYCNQTWTWARNITGPHFATEVCDVMTTGVASYSYAMTYGMVSQVPTWTFTTLDATCPTNRDASLEYDCKYAWTAGCVRMTNASAFVGTWVSDSGECYNFTGVDSSVTALWVNGDAFWPNAALQANLTGPVASFNPYRILLPTSARYPSFNKQQCMMNLSYTNTYTVYTLTCPSNPNAFLGVIHYGLFGKTPSIAGNGGYDSTWYIQQYVYDTNVTGSIAAGTCDTCNNGILIPKAAAVSALQTGAATPFLIPYTGQPFKRELPNNGQDQFNALFATQFTWAPNCRKCVPSCASCPRGKAATCLSCYPGTFLDTATSTCNANCPAGSWADAYFNLCRMCTADNGCARFNASALVGVNVSLSANVAWSPNVVGLLRGTVPSCVVTQVVNPFVTSYFPYGTIGVCAMQCSVR